MPSSLSVYLVDLDAVLKVFGSRDEALLKKVIQASDIADDDTDPDEFEEAEEGDSDLDLDEIDELPSSQDALRHIIMGEPYARGIGSKYGYVFTNICEMLGENLAGEFWQETRAEYLTNFDSMLVKLGIPGQVFSMDGLIMPSELIPLPPRSDAPYIGVVTVDQAAKALKAFEAVDPVKLDKASETIRTRRGEVEKAFVLGCFEEAKSWLKRSTADQKALICVYF
ncbi:MAG: DUF7691 family protein [Fimbriiglobus sp.]